MRTLACLATIVLAIPAATFADAPVVRGIVTDSEGTPVSGARVYLARNTSRAAETSQTKTGADGAFALKETPGEPGFSSYVLLAYKPGWAVAGTSIRDITDSTKPVKIELKRPEPIVCNLLDPEGKPLRKARVVLSGISTGRLNYYGRDALAELFAFRTERDGRVKIDVLPPGAGFRLSVETQEYGSQGTYFGSDTQEHRVQLRKVGTLAGRVVADDPRAVRDLRVTVRSRLRDAPEHLAPYARVETRTGHEGRFEVPALAAGEVTVRVEVNRDLPYRVKADETEQGRSRGHTARLEAGETAEVKIRLVEGVPIRGTVVKRQSHQAIPGATVLVNGAGGFSQRAHTGQDGRYQTFVGPGEVSVSLADVPSPYIEPIDDYRRKQVKPDAKELVLKPFVATRGVSVRGTVLDEDEAPVADARVVAHWQQHEGRIFSLGSDAATTGSHGTFVLKRVGPDVAVALTAATNERATREVVKIHTGNMRQARLRIVPEGKTVVAGRIVDESGDPIRKARVRLYAARSIPTGRIYGQSAVDFAGEEDLVTGAEGRFRTPKSVPLFTKYSLRVEADGFLPHKTDWLALEAGEEQATVSEIVLRRTGTAAGRIVNRRGKPVSGATVFTWAHEDRRGYAETTTGDDGHFRLGNMHPDAWFVFVRKKGHRLTGAAVPDQGDELRMTLREVEAPIPPKHQLATRTLADGEKGRLLKKLLVAVFRKGQQADAVYLRTEALKRLAPYDPTFVSKHLESIDSPRRRVDVLLALGRIDEAVAAAETIESPYRRAFRYRKIADAVDDPSRKQQFLAEAAVQARTIQDPARRVVTLASVAERLWDAGRKQAAEQMLRRTLPTARQLASADWSGYARGTFAETLALIDLETALELTKDLPKDEYAYDRHHGNIAHELAGIAPEQAERILKMLIRRSRRGNYAVRVCYRMAPVDLDRARRIAGSVDDADQKARAYGVMARALAENDPETARRLLRRAFTVLEKGSPDRHRRRSLFRAGFSLLGIAETVDPEATREYFWRTVALHPGPAGAGFSVSDDREYRDAQLGQLALLLALYEQQTATCRELMEPFFKHAAAEPAWCEPDHQRDPVFAAMGLVDPRQAVQLAVSYLPQARKDSLRTISPQQFWAAVADTIGKPRSALWRYLREELLHTWPIDREDI